MKRYPTLFVVLFILTLALPVHSGQAETRTMAITPFTVTSGAGLADLETGLIDLFASRIALKNQIDIVDKGKVVDLYRHSDKGPQQRILDVGRLSHSDYILTGSLDQSTKGLVLRAFVIDTQTGEPLLELSERSGPFDSTDAIIPLVNLIATAINRDLFSRAVPEKSKPRQTNAPYNIYAHPDKLLKFVPENTEK